MQMDVEVKENDDGSFTVEWDRNDPRYSIFNDMSEEQFSEWANQAILNYIESLK